MRIKINGVDINPFELFGQSQPALPQLPEGEEYIQDLPSIQEQLNLLVIYIGITKHISINPKINQFNLQKELALLEIMYRYARKQLHGY